jgi:hypothetical protein
MVRTSSPRPSTRSGSRRRPRAAARRGWDAAIDSSGYEPGDVARSSALDLAHHVFVSVCNVYPGWPAEVVDEDTPVWTEGDDYGPKKAACERSAEAAMPGRVASVRAGLLCGPHDNVFRRDPGLGGRRGDSCPRG